MPPYAPPIAEVTSGHTDWEYSGEALIDYENIYTSSQLGANQNDFTFKPISLKGFGTRVAVSGSQNVPYPAVYVFYEEYVEGRDVWSNQAILTPSPISNAGQPNFGQGLGFDGSTVIAGSNHDDAVGLRSGSAFVFTGSWLSLIHI